MYTIYSQKVSICSLCPCYLSVFLTLYFSLSFSNMNTLCDTDQFQSNFAYITDYAYWSLIVHITKQHYYICLSVSVSLSHSLSLSEYTMYVYIQIQHEAKKSEISGILADFGNFFSTRHGYQYYWKFSYFWIFFTFLRGSKKNLDFLEIGNIYETKKVPIMN